MYTSQHSEFILTPLIKILIDGISACHAIGDGMDSYPMGEYLMQSLFLKMTGAQEQKMKCICWDLATTDYEYRYEFLNKKSYGECSDYKSKNGIYNDLIAAIEHKDSSFSISTLIDAVLLNRTISKINEVFSKSSLSIWQNREYVFYQLHKVNIFSSTQIGKPKQNGAKAYSLFLLNQFVGNEYDGSYILDKKNYNAARVALISNILLGIKEEIVTKAPELKFETQIFADELAKSVSMIATKTDNGYVIDGYSFSDAATVVAMIRNKLAHGNFMFDLDHNRVILDFAGIGVKLNIDKLATFVIYSLKNYFRRVKMKVCEKSFVMNEKIEKNRTNY